MSAEALKWVFDRSTHKGNCKFLLVLIAYDSDWTGKCSEMRNIRLEQRTGLHRDTVRVCLKAIEESGELVCLEQGNGRRYSSWQIPGVLRDGYAEKRHVQNYPQGAEYPPPRGRKTLPQGAEFPPPLRNKETLKGGCNTLEEIRRRREPPPPAAAPPPEPPEKCPYELRQILFESPYEFDLQACDQLWGIAYKNVPGLDVERFMGFFQPEWERCAYRKNPRGVVLKAWPGIMQLWREKLEREGGLIAPPSPSTNGPLI